MKEQIQYIITVAILCSMAYMTAYGVMMWIVR